MLWLPLCLLLGQSFAGHEAEALGTAYRNSFKRQLDFIISRRPAYAWGGASSLEKGLDCSGYIFLAAKWAGLPGVTRTTAYRMSLGLGGWPSQRVLPDQAEECDLAFWTFSPLRPCGHVGAILDKSRELSAGHASTTRGVIKEPLKGSLRKNLSSMRRLTIGD